MDIRNYCPDGIRVRLERLPDADPLYLESVELGEIVHHGVLGEELREGEAANLYQVSVIIITPENLSKCQLAGKFLLKIGPT